MRASREHVVGAIPADSAVSALRTEAGWYQVLRVPRTRSDEQWALDLLDAGVLVQPGYFYDFPVDGHLVISLLTREEELHAGLARLVARVDDAAG